VGSEFLDGLRPAYLAAMDQAYLRLAYLAAMNPRVFRTRVVSLADSMLSNRFSRHKGHLRVAPGALRVGRGSITISIEELLVGALGAQLHRERAAMQLQFQQALP
jgi:hypothetical protein